VLICFSGCTVTEYACRLHWSPYSSAWSCRSAICRVVGLKQAVDRSWATVVVSGTVTSKYQWR